MDTEEYTYFQKENNVEIERKSPTKVIIRNTVTGAKKALSDKTDIKIIEPLISGKEIAVEELAIKLEIARSRIISLLKKLAKRNLLKDVTETYQLFDTPNDNRSRKVPDTGIA